MDSGVAIERLIHTLGRHMSQFIGGVRPGVSKGFKQALFSVAVLAAPTVVTVIDDRRRLFIIMSQLTRVKNVNMLTEGRAC